MKIDVLSLVKDGPIPVRGLRGRCAAFQIEYKRLLLSGQIVERGMGTRQDPVYVGLRDAKFPPRKMTVRLADVCLLMLAGATEEEARRTLTAIVNEGEEAVAAVCAVATEHLINTGREPIGAVRTAINRYHKGKPILPPGTEYDVTNRPLV